MTDMARLHAGRVGGQFWSVFIPAESTATRAIRNTLEEIDIVKRFIAAYPNDLEQAYTADDVVRIHKAGRVASLIGVEGGHQMGAQLAALRQYLQSWRPLHDADPLQDHRLGRLRDRRPKHDGLTDSAAASSTR